MNEPQAAAPTENAPEYEFTLLFVDDEANILASLKRLFRPHGYRIFTAESGALGLQIMEREAVDLVISDMRMPEMNGAQFLEKVRDKWPDTVRILLTGYAEIAATIDAINKGQIYRYISKPWDDHDIVLVVRLALQQKLLEREKLRLEVLVRGQNEELKELNANLEEKVKARTEEVRKAMLSLEAAHDKLKKSFITSIRVFSNLIEMREGGMAGHSRRVADLARSLAQHMGMSNAEVQDVFLAGLLHDVGKIGLSDRLLEKPFTSLSTEERFEVIKHPIKGQTALMALEQLQGAAIYIRGHHERFDGLGYPDKLAGLAIPLGARILAVANDYDSAQFGTLLTRHLKQSDALAFIIEGRGRRYDTQVVDAFMEVMGKNSVVTPSAPELVLRSEQIKPGMVLARDLMSKSGELLLAKDYILDQQLIGQIMNYERLGEPLLIYISARK
jgi:response regulator RpfG family c-di-GMP phosphodiesterase